MACRSTGVDKWPSTYLHLWKQWYAVTSTEYHEALMQWQECQASHYRSGPQILELYPGQAVWVQKPDKSKWEPSRATQSSGELSSYQIQLQDGSVLCRMNLHLKPRDPASDPEQQDINPTDAIPAVAASMPVPEPPHSLPVQVKQKVKVPPPDFPPVLLSRSHLDLQTVSQALKLPGGPTKVYHKESPES